MRTTISTYRNHTHGLRCTRNAGATLVELLAVLVIIVLLAAAAVPVIAPAMKNRQIREASRQVNGFLSGARSRAMQNGRPVGVVLERLSGLNQACVTLSYAEVPPPYAGDSTSSMVTITGSQITGLGSDVGWIGSIRLGDMIRLNYQGTYYQLVPNPSPPNSSPQAFDVTTGFYNQDPSQPNYPWQLAALPGSSATPPSGTFRYQFIRAPVKIAAGSLQLSSAAAIDLTCSGFDGADGLVVSAWVTRQSLQPIWKYAGVDPATLSSANSPFTNANREDTSNIAIMFSPSGALDSVWCWANGAVPPSFPSPVTAHGDPVPIPLKPVGPLHLMVGRRDLLPLPYKPPVITDPNNSGFTPYLNWQDLGNFWVSINPQTGLIATVENNVSATAIGNNTYGNSGYGTYIELLEARQLALESQAMGGTR